MDWVFAILFGVIWTIGTPIIAIVALVRTVGVRDQNARLEAELRALRQRIEQMQAAPVELLPSPLEAEPQAEAAVPEAPPAEPAPEPPLPPQWIEPRPAPPQVGLEQRLGSRAFIWVGAITLALAAIFLVRYSIEEGYLSPEVRVILAALFGFSLIAAAERVRRRDDRVAQAMAAAGIAAIYGALFSSVALYDMISKAAGGIGAAALTGFAIGVSLRHGMLVAALAFVGGFLSPAIIGSAEPDTPVLFGYLLAIAAGTLAAIRYRGWWPLGWGVLAGSALWVVAWMMGRGGGTAWVGLFLVAVAGLFVWTAWRRMAESENPPNDVVVLVWIALGSTGILLVALIVQDHARQGLGWAELALHGAGLYALARWTPRFQYVATLVPLLSLLALALWWADTRGFGSHWDGDRFAWAAILLGGLYAAGAFALMWNAGRPGFWAALSVGAALAHFLLCWWVLRSSASGAPWGLISVGLAVPFLVGAERLVRWREQMTGATEALGFLAAGVSFFIAAAIPLELNREWITVAYALELAAVAVIAATLDLWAMRQICWGLLAIVVVRFVLNPEVLKYPLGLTPVLNWILWSYIVAIGALGVGLRYLRRTPDDRLVRAVEAAMGLLVFVLLTLEVRSVFQPDSMSAPHARFMERAVYVLVWGAFALGALWMARRRQNDPVALWAWRLSGIIVAAVALFVQAVALNPVAEKTDVGELPILNGLFVAYAVPAAMAALARYWVDGVEKERYVGLSAGFTAGALAFVYVSFEVRHFFDPGFDRWGYGADGLELYAYSFVWLAFGVAMLALGLLRHSTAFRHAGMAMVCIVVAKVFLIDMAGLEGLLRVFSFLGLGAALLGLGYAYRRFGFAQRSGPIA